MLGGLIVKKTRRESREYLTVCFFVSIIDPMNYDIFAVCMVFGNYVTLILDLKS